MNYHRWLVIFALAASILAMSPPSATHASPPNPAEWQLTFSDDFDLGYLDLNKWNTSYFWGRTIPSNGEAEYYTDDAFQLNDGILNIRADRRQMDGFNYTSGVITSHGKFSQKYGYFEIRAKMPSGKALWPAFWLLPESQDYPPEIDIFEVFGCLSDSVAMTVHYLDSLRNQQWLQGLATIDNLSHDFHTFAIDWEADLIIWYVDGVEKFRSYTGIPNEAMYVIANLAVGGTGIGYPDDSTVFPCYLAIDYIRVYQRSSVPSPSGLRLR